MEKYREKIYVIILFLGIYFFVLSLSGIREAWVVAFASEGKGQVAEKYISRVLGEPLSGLFAGILATSLVQSSSGVVAVTIASVGAGAITVSQAVPLVMGANIGTTVTNIIVSLGYSFRKQEFSKAVPVALVHDMFNILNVSTLFVLEYTTHILSKSALFFGEFIGNLPIIGNFLGSFPDFVDIFTEPILKPMVNFFVGFFGKTYTSAIFLGIFFFFIMFFSLELMSKSSRVLVGNKTPDLVDKAFKTDSRGVLMGISVTFLVQSSSVSTSLIVPFAASGIVDLRKAYPYQLGCNIGTTIDPSQIISYIKFGVLGLKIGLVHVFLNLFGVFIWLGIPFLRKIPIRMAEELGKIITTSKISAIILIIYTVVMFYIIPLIVIYLG